MSDLNRIKKLSGILNEEMDKGDMHDTLGDAMIAMSDTDESVEDVADLQTLQKLAGIEEAVGDSAECFYTMQDEFAGDEAAGAHKTLIDELVRYLSGDQLEDFCDDFKRHHMNG